MTSVQDLESHIRAYLQGKADVGALEEWLASHTEEASHAEDDVRRLHNSAWLKIGEFDTGLLSEEQLAAELEALLQTSQTMTWQGLRVGSVGRAHNVVAPQVTHPVGSVTTRVESPWVGRARS